MTRTVSTAPAALAAGTLLLLAAAWSPEGPVPPPLAPLTHANVFHCMANLWALATAWRYLHVRWTEVAAAYVIAVAALLPPWPHVVVGLSGLAYALMALAAMRLRLTPHGRLRYHGGMLFFIVLSIVVPAFAGWYHLVCYAAGCVVGRLMTLLRWNTPT